MTPSKVHGGLPPPARRPNVLASAARALFGRLLPLFNQRGDGPPDLDELWRDFNRKLSGLFGGKGGSRPPRLGGGGGDGGGFQPDMKSAGLGLFLIGGVVALVWLGSGVFIVQEGQQAVVTTFGRYTNTREAGIQFRWPYPFQAHETVSVTQLQS
ncbi:MAG: protease modulator HflK N-terminal domain-containing protein, partial [Aquincola sp.]|nr:protease modulator HflK N-terminal domain-containing protein [Aquincola sp.]